MSTYAFTGSLTRPMPQYGAANGKGLSVLGFSDASGGLGQIGISGGVDDTAWLVPDPARRVMFTTCEVSGTDQSAVAAYAIGPAGLTFINRQPTLGNEACHASLSNDGRFLLVANYNGANPPGYPEAALSVFPVSADGHLSPAVASVTHKGSGPNKDRQTTAHAHCVVPEPHSDRLYVADLGIDTLVCYRLGADGSLTAHPTGDFALPPGLGPRHLVFSAEGRSLYLVSELTPTVMSFAVDPATGTLTLRDRFDISVPSGGTIVQPAGIVLDADGRHLFVGLRVSQEILGLAIDAASGKLSQTGRWPSGGDTPRDLCLSPDGAHLVVANQDSDRLTVFPVSGGTLGAPLHHFAVGTPMAVKLAGL